MHIPLHVVFYYFCIEYHIPNFEEELEKTYHDIYDILALLFKANENSSANTVFYSNLFKKCKDKGVFNQFIELIHNIINTDNNLPRLPHHLNVRM